MINETDLRMRLSQVLGCPPDDPLLEQFLRLLGDWQVRNPTAAEAYMQLEQHPTLAQLSSLISFQGATVEGGVTIGDVAAGDIFKLVLQQVIFINVEGGRSFLNGLGATRAYFPARDSDKTGDRTNLSILPMPEQSSVSRALTELDGLFRTVFNAKEEIWQSECSRATDNLQTLSRMAQQLVNRSHREEGLITVGERMILENIGEHTSSLISSINRFHDACPPSYRYEVGRKSKRYMNQYNEDRESIRMEFQVVIDDIGSLKEHERAFLLLFPSK